MAGAKNAALADATVMDDRIDDRVGERRKRRSGGKALCHHDLPSDIRSRGLGIARVADRLVVDEIDLAALTCGEPRHDCRIRALRNLPRGAEGLSVVCRVLIE